MRQWKITRQVWGQPLRTGTSSGWWVILPWRLGAVHEIIGTQAARRNSGSGHETPRPDAGLVSCSGVGHMVARRGRQRMHLASDHRRVARLGQPLTPPTTGRHTPDSADQSVDRAFVFFVLQRPWSATAAVDHCRSEALACDHYVRPCDCRGLGVRPLRSTIAGPGIA